MFFQFVLGVSIIGLLLIFIRRLRLTLKDIAFQKEVEQEMTFKDEPKLSSDEHFTGELKNIIQPKKKKNAKHTRMVRETLQAGETHLAQGLFYDAERDFIRVLAFHPNHVQALHKLGMIYMQQENMIKAEEMFRTLVKVKKSPVYFSNLALSLYHQQKYEEAVKYYEKAIKLDDKRAARYVNLALVYNKMGKTQKSLKNLEKASSLDPRNTEYLFMLARLLEDLNRKKEAIVIYERVLYCEPYNEEAKRAVEQLKSADVEY